MALIKVDCENPEKNIIEPAAKIIKNGGLVAFSTETVYGLGANALDPSAVAKIFVAKNRPADNPLIIHIANVRDLQKYAQDIPEEALILANKFWPGPLTLVLKKKPIVPDIVTAGSDTVAIRFPNNKIALALIEFSGVPIAAPSANLSGKPSPTTAQDVLNDLGDNVEMILDGGSCSVGLESTVLDLSSRPYNILRPGGVTYEQLKPILKDLVPLQSINQNATPKSPGMKYRHYSPKAKLVLVKQENSTEKMLDLMLEYKKKGLKVGILSGDSDASVFSKAEKFVSLGKDDNLEEISRNLFSSLREFDKWEIDVIIARSFPEEGLGVAIMNRLEKAASEVI